MLQQSIAKSVYGDQHQTVDASDSFTLIRNLMYSQVQCVLATVNASEPSQHLMAYAFEQNLSTVFVATMRETQKAKNMLQHPAVSLLWDNRTGISTDHTEGLALVAQCTAKPIEGWVRARAAHLLKRRNPELEALLSQRHSVLFEIIVGNYRLAQGYERVTTWVPQ